jgi:nicotinate-nucleotide adenylyltransferase
MPNKKILGILGGTFDPIHYGHLNIAEFCMHEFSMDQIIFIPCHIPSHRPTPQANSSERLAMLKIAILGYDKFSIDTIEMDKDTESYSYNTLTELRKKFPEQNLSFILGMDSFETLNTWQNYNKILDMCNIIVVNRPGYEIPDTNWSNEILRRHLITNKEEFLQHKHGKVFMISIPPQDISATQIRNILKQKSGDLINVPTKVKEYMDQHNLYKNNQE